MMGPSDSVTLGEAREWLRDLVDDGVKCPCCTQFAKVYRRRIHHTMAWHLIRCYQHTSPGEWFHLPTMLDNKATGDFCKFEMWGLIEPEGEGVRADGSTRTGWWRVTDAGRAYVRNQLAVPKYARIYDGRCLGLFGDPVKIGDALGKKFNYDDLMRGL